MNKIYKIILFVILLFATSTYAQFTISGVVTDASTGDKLIGANVYLPDEHIGAATDMNGEYSISVPAGTHKMTCSYIGFDRMDRTIEVNADMTLNFAMKEYQFTLSVTVLSDRVKERETPVAYTNIDKRQMEFELGSKDIPLVLNTAPSVFATDNGGGSGDARINVRGFNQRNIGIMINGIPINDMENGWVYWSNWDGLGDATSSIQMQRGLSAVNLATPSIGGTINIITDPTQHKAGAYFKNEFGTGNFSKQTFFGHTGLVADGKFAMSFGGVRKVGDGVVDGAWTDAWAYYLGMSYEINSKNRLELYALGAPQQHGQRRWKLNAATFSHKLARDLGYTDDVFADSRFAERGIRYNSNWSGVSSSYTGEQWTRSYWNTNLNQRHDLSFINESQNYYHKPLVNLNWYSQLSDKVSLYSTVYYSGGQGGGVGTFGSLRWDYTLLQRVIDYDATIERNAASSTGSYGILRNSVNTQWTIGAVSKAFWKATDNLNMSFGIDARYAEIEHFREVRDLLGGAYYYYDGNEFDTPAQYNKLLGDRIDYNNINTVNWLGGYVQGEYTKDQWTYYGTAGYSIIKYDYTDYFHPMVEGDINSGYLNLVSDWIGGYQFKGGASYRLNDEVQLYFNAGYVDQVPTFDQVISDVDGKFVENRTNNKFLSAELGTRTNWWQNKVALNANVYFTQWMDQSTDRLVEDATTGDERLIRLQGLDTRYMGFELEGSVQPARCFRFDASFSYGIWEYTDDVNGTYIIDFTTGESEPYHFYIKDLKVGDAPQMQLAAAVTLTPVTGLRAQLVWRLYDNYYSQFDPFSRTDSVEVADNHGKAPQVWQIPSYNIFDLHFSYNLPAKIAGADVTLFAHVFNLFNELYVEDATDNSAYNGYTANNEELGTHRADDAEIYPGLPTTFNVGFSVGL